MKKYRFVIFFLFCSFLFSGCMISEPYYGPHEGAQLSIKCQNGELKHVYINGKRISGSFGSSATGAILPLNRESFITYMLTYLDDYRSTVSLYYTPTSINDKLLLTTTYEGGYGSKNCVLKTKKKEVLFVM